MSFHVGVVAALLVSGSFLAAAEQDPKEDPAAADVPLRTTPELAHANTNNPRQMSSRHMNAD